MKEAETKPVDSAEDSARAWRVCLEPFCIKVLDTGDDEEAEAGNCTKDPTDCCRKSC